jgi:benzodiazapine receptor
MRLVISIAVCFAAAWLGSLVTRPALEPWYAGLAKPPWTPPNWVFAPAWTTLFALMAVAAWLVWRRAGLVSTPLALFLLQLLLNVAWSWLFFGRQSPGTAMIEIVVLWGAILATTLEFWRVDRLAGWLLLPYLAWVAFAAALNFSIWRRNG